jgi:aspartyl-tRNA synthetase
VGESAKLAGWLDTVRDHGGIIFLDLRDYYGVTQVVLHDGEALAGIARESVVSVEGVVALRDEDTVNAAIATGEVELRASGLELLGAARQELPFPVRESHKTREDLRLKYRYLDLRNPEMSRKIRFRSEVISHIRHMMDGMGFLEVQTPILTASSPEGARDYLVPSRKHQGMFYALPQAPQQFKQLLMASGFDRYYQIAPCFRDEDARADRAPGEFYQLDFEMAFAEQEDVFEVAERVLHGTFGKFSEKSATSPPFPRLTYRECMLRYGTDKPDLRNPLVIEDLSGFFSDVDFKPFRGRQVRGVVAPGCAGRPRSFFDRLLGYATGIGMKGLGYISVFAAPAQGAPGAQAPAGDQAATGAFAMGQVAAAQPAPGAPAAVDKAATGAPATAQPASAGGALGQTATGEQAAPGASAMAQPASGEQPASAGGAATAATADTAAAAAAQPSAVACGLEMKGPIVKFLSAAKLAELAASLRLRAGDTLFFISDAPELVDRYAGLVRSELGGRLGLVDESSFRFCFVVDYPMFELDAETGRAGFTHNPFSMPQGGLGALLEKDPLDVLAYQYDIVCNGVELSSGAVRNHRPDIMEKAFEIAGYPAGEVERRFPALINAFRLGAPPHAGMAPGIDRIVMLLLGEENIREVIAFPMNSGAQDLLMGAPAPVTEQQLREAHIKLR